MKLWLATNELAQLCQLPHTYHDSITDAVADLGQPEDIGKVFSGFQRYL